MDYSITVITLSSQATSSSANLALQNTPFSNLRSGQSLTFDVTETETLTISDDDANLDGVYYNRTSETDQRLIETITLGPADNPDEVTEGTQIGWDFASWIYDADGNVYQLAFPRSWTNSGLGAIEGDRYSIMVIPVGHNDDSNTWVEPVPFDPTREYYFGGNGSYTSSTSSIAYYEALDVDCFATGTLIDTPDGPRAVETLGPGDLVITRDNGAEPLLWSGHVQVDARRLDLQPALRPIRIAAGALGDGMPARDLVLSPQHRVLVRSAIVRRMFDSASVLVAAKHLVGLPGIEIMPAPDGVGYHHLLFAGHRIVRSEGAWTESLYLGPQALKGLGPSGRREVMALFPELSDPDFRPDAARPLATGREGRKLAERHGRNRKRLVEATSR